MKIQQSVSFDEQDMKALRKWAEQEDTSVAAMVRKIVRATLDSEVTSVNWMSVHKGTGETVRVLLNNNTGV